MFKIYNDEERLWQWDVGQRLIVADDICSEVHFCNGTSECALVCEVYEEDGLRFVNIPNILLQDANPLKVFNMLCGDDEQHTKNAEIFPVFKRSKPDDYVYTETEIKSYAVLSKRIDELEKNGVSEEQIEKAVNAYLNENPIDTGMPDITPADENAVLTVENGSAVWKTLPKYDGEYEVTPSTENASVLKTGQKFVDSDIKVKKIPFYEFDNTSGGTTIYIGSENELIFE